MDEHEYCDYETEHVAWDYETGRTNYLRAFAEIQKAKLAIGKVICLYGTTLEASENPHVHVLGSESTVTKQFSQDELLYPHETRKLTKVYYHYCYLPNPKATRFSIDYLCTIHIDNLVRFIPLLLQHYRNSRSGIGSRIRVQQDLIEINTDLKKRKTKWRELSDFGGCEVGELLKVQGYKRCSLSVYPQPANLHIRSESALESSVTFYDSTDFVVDRLLGDLRFWPGGELQEPLEDLDNLYCMNLTLY